MAIVPYIRLAFKTLPLDAFVSYFAIVESEDKRQRDAIGLCYHLHICDVWCEAVLIWGGGGEDVPS